WLEDACLGSQQGCPRPHPSNEEGVLLRYLVVLDPLIRHVMARMVSADRPPLGEVAGLRPNDQVGPKRFGAIAQPLVLPDGSPGSAFPYLAFSRPGRIANSLWDIRLDQGYLRSRRHRILTQTPVAVHQDGS